MAPAALLGRLRCPHSLAPGLGRAHLLLRRPGYADRTGSCRLHSQQPHRTTQRRRAPLPRSAAAPETGPPPLQPAVRSRPLPPQPTVVAHGRPLPPDVWQNAVVLIDKPTGWTSFDVCGKLRRVINMKKVGHAGTLDPNATGLLIVCTGKGTKHVDSFMAQAKAYEGRLRLGEATPSYDADTAVCERLPWEGITDAQLQAVRAQFVGDIHQVPPMFSAIKVKGERLYQAARRGEEVARAPRAVSISELRLARDADDAQCVHFSVACSKGTYVRSLVHDLGRALGSAAHMTALRRTRIGEHCVEDAWSIEALAQAVATSRGEAPG